MHVAVKPATEPPVAVGLWSLPIGATPGRDMAVVVVLVDDRNALSDVDQGKPHLEGATHHPVVPARAPDRKRRKSEVGVAGEDKVVAASAKVEPPILMSPG